MPGHIAGVDRGFWYNNNVRDNNEFQPKLPQGGATLLSTLDFVLVEFRQGGKKLYNGSGIVREIDWCTVVPRMDYKAKPSETIPEVTSTTLEPYQRPLDDFRKNEISNWFNDNDNHIANAPLVWFSEAQQVSTEAEESETLGEGKGTIREITGHARNPVKLLRIPFVDDRTAPEGFLHIRLRNSCSCNDGDDPWVAASAASWFDSCPKCGWTGRPGEIIDGQHRIRGGASASNVNRRKSCIPLSVLFAGAQGFDPSSKAKLFTEVTVEAIDLDPLHKLNLKYRSGELTDGETKLYKALAELCGETGGVLYDMIDFIPAKLAKKKSKRAVGTIASIIQMMKWSENSGLTEHFSTKTEQYVKNTIRNWFTVISTTDWAGEPHAVLWTGLRKPRAPLGEPTHTEALFSNLMPAIEKLAEANITGTPTVTQLRKIVTYIKQIDMKKSSPAFNMWHKGGQNARDQLRVLIKALINDMSWDNAAGNWTHSTPLSDPMAWINRVIASRGNVDQISNFSVTRSPLTASDANPFSVEWEVAKSENGFTHNDTKFPLNASKHKATIRLTNGGEIWNIPTFTNPFELESSLTKSGFNSGDVVTIDLVFTNMLGEEVVRNVSTGHQI
ncbi:MAG: hypothetical protein CMA39_04110 [Euryarchaeota archaeon]|nr:hypothetical protein [Euryarchaeota archaeon]|tara:strand:+ start:789 stop:2633 length:1845 start_codon:yes stop_codon:yes gene_type:complete